MTLFIASYGVFCPKSSEISRFLAMFKCCKSGSEMVSKSESKNVSKYGSTLGRESNAILDGTFVLRNDVRNEPKMGS